MMSDSDERPDDEANPDGPAWPDGPYGATVADGSDAGGTSGDGGTSGGSGLSGGSGREAGGTPADRPSARARRPFRPVHRTLSRGAKPTADEPPDPYGATAADAGSLADGADGPGPGLAAGPGSADLLAAAGDVTDPGPAVPAGTRGTGGAAGGRGAGPVNGFAARDAYEIVHPIGEGGMGRVDLAWNPRLHKWVAIKRLSTRFLHDPKLLARFRTEARSVASLTHYHIVPVYDMAEDDLGPYIVMEYVAGPGPGRGRGAGAAGGEGEDGGEDGADRPTLPAPPGWGDDLPPPPLTLEQEVKAYGKYDVARAARLGRQLCSAVGYAHRRNVIHRDIKPANILVNTDGDVRLTDFGLALRRDKDDGEANAIEGTLAGARLLTLGYGAPEQESDASKVDERADIYALGATLWYVLTGQSPRHFRESEAPGPFRAILAEAMQRDREKRTPTADALDRKLARLEGTAARQAAAGGDGAARVAGACAQCGHVHALDAARPLDRKFCEACGARLTMACLRCGAANGVWARYCGPCGADLDALARNRAAALRVQRDGLDGLIRQSRYAEAVVQLEEAAALDHPALAEFAAWAEGRLPDLRAEFEAVQRQRDAAVETARAYVAGRDYKRAVEALDAVPAPLRSEPCQQVRAEAAARLDELLSLSNDIRRQRRVGQLVGLGPKVERWLALQPPTAAEAAATARVLLEQVRKREEQAEDDLWKAADMERTPDACRQYLSAHPDGRYARQVGSILAPILRDRLLRDPANVRLREEYLGCRPAALARDDLAWARNGVGVSFAIFGLAGGAVAGALVGAVAGVGVVVVAGLLGGAVAGFLAGRRST